MEHVSSFLGPLECHPIAYCAPFLQVQRWKAHTLQQPSSWTFTIVDCRHSNNGQLTFAPKDLTKMAESSDDGAVRNLLPLDSIKIIGESAGITNLNDDAATMLSEDLEYRLKELVQDATKIMRQMKRKKLACADFDCALRTKNVEPLYGFNTTDYVPFRHTSGGGKDLYYTDEKELGLLELINSPLDRLPCDVTIRAHWLCVEGVQPVIPENPPPATLEGQRSEALGGSIPSLDSNDPVSKLKKIKFDKKAKAKGDVIGTEWSKLKPLQAHALSLEQQLYYKEITDACIGVGPESKCQEALNSMSADPGLYQLLPQFISFINEGIRINISQRNLMTLKHLVRMIGALLENPSLLLDKYLHELIPSLVSCLINKQVCMRPESEDQWSMRDSVGKVLAKMCKKYSNLINNIQPRVTRILCHALKNGTTSSSTSPNQGLAVHYGVICGLGELGQEAITSLIIPQLKLESTLIRAALSQQGKVVEHVAANRLQSLLVRHCAPVLLVSRPVSDTVTQYQADYGAIGVALFNQVKTLRQNRTGLLSTVTARVTGSSTLKSSTVTIAKTRPPPLSFASPHVLSVKTGASARTQNSPVITSISSPSIAAALQLVSQVAKSNPSTPTSSSTQSSSNLPVSLLSAVMNSPGAQAVLAEHLSAVLTGNGSGASGNSVVSSASPSPGQPEAGSPNNNGESVQPTQIPGSDPPFTQDT